MGDTKITIIVPAYNVEKYIQKTLYSIIKQSYPPFELIVINDGSNDETLTIIRKTLAKSNLNYHIIDKENEGVSAARNEGIQSAQGDYIFFLDGDDFIAEDCLEKMHQARNKYSTPAVYVNYIKISEDGQKWDLNSHLNLPKVSDNEFLIRLEATMTITFSFCQLLYSTSILRENNLFFNPDLEYGEDTEFALRFLAHAPKIAWVDENLIYYLQRDNSSTSHTLFKRYDFIKALDGIIEYYKKNKVSNELIELIAHYRIPKSIWGNTIFLSDSSLPFEEVLDELKRRNLISRLNSFKSINKKDYLFWLKIKTFTWAPNFYYHLRKVLKH